MRDYYRWVCEELLRTETQTDILLEEKLYIGLQWIVTL